MLAHSINCYKLPITSIKHQQTYIAFLMKTTSLVGWTSRTFQLTVRCLKKSKYLTWFGIIYERKVRNTRSHVRRKHSLTTCFTRHKTNLLGKKPDCSSATERQSEHHHQQINLATNESVNVKIRDQFEVRMYCMHLHSAISWLIGLNVPNVPPTMNQCPPKSDPTILKQMTLIFGSFLNGKNQYFGLTLIN